MNDNTQAQQAANIANFLPVLEGWYGWLISELYGTPPWRSKGILMGCPLWGDAYLDRFEKYCLPSLMSPTNKGILAGRCRFVFFTDSLSYARLLSITKPMEKIGFDLQPCLIPPEVMKYAPVDPLNKYWILGVAQNALVQMAGRAGMAFHMLMPDHVYAHEYFDNLFRLAGHHEGIAQTGISANVLTAGPELEKFIGPDDSLTIPDVELGEIGWRHLHRQSKAALMNYAQIPEALPESHFLLWRMPDRLRMFCCHMNMAYLSAAYCDVAPSRIPATIDSEMPSFMPRDFYVPTMEDGMTFIEISDDSKQDRPNLVDLDGWAHHCWIKVRHKYDWMPYFHRACDVPTKPYDVNITGDQIATHHRMLVREMYARQPDLAAKFISGLAYQ